MTIEEKLQHFKTFTTESARKEASKVIEEQKRVLEANLEEYKMGKDRQIEREIEEETKAAYRSANKVYSLKQIELRKSLTDRKNEIKDHLFKGVLDRLIAFKQSDDYMDYMVKKIEAIKKFAGDNDVQIYIDHTDVNKKNKLEMLTGTRLLVEDDSIIGGVLGVIEQRNILIDDSFIALYREKKENFVFREELENE